MSNRSLPFLIPSVGNEQEEAIALLSCVAGDLLRDHHQAVEATRHRAELYSNIAFGGALLALALLLAQIELAPIAVLVGLALLALLALLLGIGLRTRLVEASRFTPPEILAAQKLSWQWLAIPLDEDGLILWDTLTDESVLLDLPPDPPARPDLFLRDLDSLRSIEDEKRLINRLGEILGAWQSPAQPVRLPQIKAHAETLLDFLGNLPRGRHVTPAPALPPARPLERGQEELRLLMRLHQNHRILLRQLDAWEEAVPHFKRSLERALKTALPTMDAPPAPPTAHPSGDVEAVIGTLDLVRSTAIESLRGPLQDELARQQESLVARLKEMEQDWERERNAVFYSSETLISSLQRQTEDLEQRVIPDAERALKESQTRLNEANDRAMKCEAELAEKRKQLLLAGSGSNQSPRASDERKRELSTTIDRLTSTLPEMKRAVTTWEEVVSTQRAFVERERQRLERLQQEYREYARQREEQLTKIDATYEAARKVLDKDYQPIIQSIEADLAFFEILNDRFSTVLEPYRVDLIMEDESRRPYTEIVQKSYQILEEKITAIQRWDEQVRGLIRKRRETVQRIVQELEGAALPNIGLRQLRVMLLPIWYVEVRPGVASLWPGRKREPAEQIRLLAPFVESSTGQRLALPGGNPLFLDSLDVLQERLDSLVAGERRESLKQAARRLGRTVPFDPKLLNTIAIASQMPRAMVDLLLPLHQGPRLAPADAALPSVRTDPARTGRLDPLPVETGDLSDEFDPGTDEAAGVDEDAWQAEEPTGEVVEEDAWGEEPNGAEPSIPALPTANSTPAGKRAEEGESAGREEHS